MILEGGQGTEQRLNLDVVLDLEGLTLQHGTWYSPTRCCSPEARGHPKHITYAMPHDDFDKGKSTLTKVRECSAGARAEQCRANLSRRIASGRTS